MLRDRGPTGITSGEMVVQPIGVGRIEGGIAGLGRQLAGPLVIDHRWAPPHLCGLEQAASRDCDG